MATYRALQRFQRSTTHKTRATNFSHSESIMTSMHLASTSHGYWDSLAMLNESDLEPNKIFPPEVQSHNKDNAVSRSTVDIIQHAESVLASTDDLFLDLDLEPFPVHIFSKGGDVPKTIIPPPVCINWLKQTDNNNWLNLRKDLPIASARLEDTLDMFINSISQPDEEVNLNEDYDWIAMDENEDADDDNLDSSLSRPSKRRRQTEEEGQGMSALHAHTLPAPCVSLSMSPCSSSSDKTVSTESSSDEVRFRGYQADQWMERFEDLKNFKAEVGNCLVPHSYPPNQQLAQWVKRQRYQYKLKIENRHSTLTVERQKELEDLGFVWDSHKAAWYERLEALKQYRAKYGNCMVPTNFTEDKPLAVWVKCQRRQLKLFRSGRQSTMTEERFVELEKLGFEWNPRNL